MDDNPFDSELMDEGDALDAAVEEGGADASFDSGDGFEEADGDAFSGDEAIDDFETGDGFDQDGDAMSAWDAFESEVADGLDAADEDEFLGRILGGLGRAAGVVSRGLGGAANVSRQFGRVAGQVGQVAGRVTPAALAAAQLARMLGATNVAGGLQRLARGAGQVQGRSRQVQRYAGEAQSVMAALSRLIGQGSNEFDDFDSLADEFEQGMDGALPPAVALAARAAARGLGFGNLARLNVAGRRALVRGVAAAARELMRGRDPRALRALPRLAHSAARVAARGGAAPAAAARSLQRGLPRIARRVAQTPATLNRLAQPGGARAPRAPLSRDTTLGRGHRSARINGPRRFYIDGPVVLTVTPR